MCATHGGSAPQVRQAAARRVAEQKARDAVTRSGWIVVAGQDPLTVLENALSDVVALKQRLGVIVDRLSDDGLRYRGRAGEQIRGELAAYMASMRDVTRTAETMLKLNLAERRANVAKTEARAIVEILRAVFTRLDLTSEQQALARVAVPEEMRAASERFATEQRNRPMLPVGSKRPVA